MLTKIISQPHPNIAIPGDILPCLPGEGPAKLNTMDVFNALTYGYILIGETGEVLDANPLFWQLWTLDEPDLAKLNQPSEVHVRKNKMLEQMLNPDKFKAMGTTIYQDKFTTFVDEISLKDGRTFRRRTIPVLGPGGCYLGRGFIFEDISMEKEALKKSLHAELVQDLMSIINIVSHELRTPLNGLALVPIIIEEAVDSGATIIPRDISCIEDSLDRLTNVVDVLSQLMQTTTATISSTQQRFKLYEIIRDVIWGLDKKWQDGGLQTHIDIHPSLSSKLFRGQADTIIKVVGLLLDNAHKFTHTGSVKIIITNPNIEPQQETHLAFAVQDTGIGIDPKNHKTIFEVFEMVDKSNCRQQGGLGIGLTIAQRLIESMGGEITVTSKLGQGSLFEFTIPVEEVNT